MTAYTTPRRTTSSPASTITVLPSVPDWVPAAGQYSNVTRFDNGQIHLATAINPDKFNTDGSFIPYPTIFSHPGYGSGTGSATTAFPEVWNVQTGGTFNFELGALGSLVIYGGGHQTWDGPVIVAFDIATGLWSNYWGTGPANTPMYCATGSSVENGTVATLTGTQSNRNSTDITVTDRVSRAGNYVKTADDVVIPGSGDPLAGHWGAADATHVYHPFPIHTNRGICILPSDGGGGPKGSLIIHGHNQTGLKIDENKWSLYKYNFDTHLWDHAWRVGELMTNSRPEPTVFYDRNRKLIWEAGGSGRPVAHDYINMQRHRPGAQGGVFPNLTGGYVPGRCYMPTRDLVVVIRAINTGAELWSERDGAPWVLNNVVVAPNTPGATLQGVGCYYYPIIQGYRLTGYEFNDDTWICSTQTIHCTPSHTSYRDNIDIGVDTGWPGFKNAANGLQVTGELTHMGASDSNTLMQGGRWGWHGTSLPIGTTPVPSNSDNGRTRGVNDGLDYCEEEDCLFWVHRMKPGGDSSTPIILWKLYPPAIGQEFNAATPWTWVKEELSAAPGVSGPATTKSGNMPNWGGKTPYHPSLKCVFMSDEPSVPVQALRSSLWT